MPVSMKENPIGSGERGSVLLLVAALMVLAGFMLTLGLGPFRTDDTQDKIQRTAKRQQFLIGQLAAYAQRENKLPCPADPTVAPTNALFGFSRGANAAVAAGDTNNAGSCNNAPEGIIPFRTLGLASYDGLDGWDRLFTYRISPVLNDPFIGGSNAATPIFMRCRRFPWFNDYSHGLNLPTPYQNQLNTYPEKARFCCPPVGSTATDIQILNKALGSGGTSIDTTIGRSGTGIYDGNINSITTPTGLDPIPTTLTLQQQKQELYAFVIVSHGINGVGAYTAGSAARAAPASLDEAENADNNVTFVARPISLAPGTTYFDDMVVWRTQISLMGELNNVSCYAPWR